MENEIRHALKAEVSKKYWPRSGRYCEAGLFDRYDMMQRYKVMENDTRHVLKAEVLKNIGREAADIFKQGSQRYEVMKKDTRHVSSKAVSATR